MRAPRVPEPSVVRLSVYSHILENLYRQGVEIVSSGDIAVRAGVGPAQVRKDLTYFGGFGTRGLGYRVGDLLAETRAILGVDRRWPLIMVGAGKLARALSTYRGFTERNFHIVAVFDNDLTKIGGKIEHLDIHPMEDLPAVVDRYGVVLGIITVSPQAAQETADIMVHNGVLALLNFAPVRLKVPRYVVVQNVNLSIEVSVLTFELCHPFVSFLD